MITTTGGFGTNRSGAAKALARKAADFSSEAGMALLTVTFAMLLITIVGLAIAFSGILEVQGSSNYQRSLEAFYLADAAINHTVEEMATHHIPFNDLLRGADGIADTEDDGYLMHNSIPEGERIPSTGYSFGAGSYAVRVTDDNEIDNDPTTDTNLRVIVTAVSTAPDGARATVETIVSLGGGIPAILCDGDLKVFGDMMVKGKMGSVHANGDLLVSGSPHIDRNATAHEDYSEEGTPFIGGDRGGHRAEIPVPPVDAEYHRSKADYILAVDGYVTDVANGNLIDCRDSRVSYRGWSFTSASPAMWSSITNQNDYFPGTYFVEGSATVSGQIGRRGAVTVPFTLIAKGNIDIRGGAEVRPDSGDIFLLADGDINITGSVDQEDSQNYAGFIAAHEQLAMTGTPKTLYGHIIIEDAEDRNGLVHLNEIGGNMFLRAGNGFTSIGPTGKPQPISWREIRN